MRQIFMTNARDSSSRSSQPPGRSGSLSRSTTSHSTNLQNHLIVSIPMPRRRVHIRETLEKRVMSAAPVLSLSLVLDVCEALAS